MKCIECSSTIEVAVLSYVLDTIPEIVINNLPGYRCPQCGVEYLTREAMTQIEEIETKLHEIHSIKWKHQDISA